MEAHEGFEELWDALMLQAIPDIDYRYRGLPLKHSQLHQNAPNFAQLQYLTIGFLGSTRYFLS